MTLNKINPIDPVIKRPKGSKIKTVSEGMTLYKFPNDINFYAYLRRPKRKNGISFGIIINQSVSYPTISFSLSDL